MDTFRKWWNKPKVIIIAATSSFFFSNEYTVFLFYLILFSSNEWLSVARWDKNKAIKQRKKYEKRTLIPIAIWICCACFIFVIQNIWTVLLCRSSGPRHYLVKCARWCVFERVFDVVVAIRVMRVHKNNVIRPCERKKKSYCVIALLPVCVCVCVCTCLMHMYEPELRYDVSVYVSNVLYVHSNTG